MNPIEWLEHQVPGFASLTQRDREAIFHFALLWSLFEAKALGTWGSAAAIVDRTNIVAANGELDLKPFSGPLQHFKDRYFPGGNQSNHFQHLHVANGDKELVVQVLSGGNSTAAESVAALLIVVYRLRNNLFHGAKWAYDLQGQTANFERANEALIAAIGQLKTG